MEKWEEQGEQPGDAGFAWKKLVWRVLVAACVMLLAGSAFNIWRTIRQSRLENQTFLELAKLTENYGQTESDPLAGMEVKDSESTEKQSG